jgi:hypothetical protein
MKHAYALRAFVISVMFVCISTLAAETTPKQKSELFFQTVLKGKLDKAFEGLFEGSPFAGSKSEELQRMKDDFKKHLDSSEAFGFEQVEERVFGKSVVKLVYVLKLESHPLVWEFHFYKPKERWILARVGFDEDLRKLGDGR